MIELQVVVEWFQGNSSAILNGVIAAAIFSAVAELWRAHRGKVILVVAAGVRLATDPQAKWYLVLAAVLMLVSRWLRRRREERERAEEARVRLLAVEREQRRRLGLEKLAPGPYRPPLWLEDIPMPPPAEPVPDDAEPPWRRVHPIPRRPLLTLN